MSNISVVIHTKNNGDMLERALKSVVDFASDIVIMDMESTDDTVRIAESYDARVFTTKPLTYADPVRNEAIAKAKEPWILVLDADEEVPKPLAQLLQKLSENMEVQAYAIPRKNMIFGTWAKTGWWPDHVIRFFQKGSVYWPPEVHGQPVAKGTVMRMEPVEEFAIVHHNYTSVEQFIHRLNIYTTLEAKQKDVETHSLMHAWSNEFLRRYYEQKGYEQGKFGLTLSLLQSFYMLTAAVKKWESRGFSEELVEEFDQVDKELDEFFQANCYWIAQMHIDHEKSLIKKIYWKIRRRFRV